MCHNTFQNHCAVQLPNGRVISVNIIKQSGLLQIFLFHLAKHHRPLGAVLQVVPQGQQRIKKTVGLSGSRARELSLSSSSLRTSQPNVAEGRAGRGAEGGFGYVVKQCWSRDNLEGSQGSMKSVWKSISRRQYFIAQTWSRSISVSCRSHQAHGVTEHLIWGQTN